MCKPVLQFWYIMTESTTAMPAIPPLEIVLYEPENAGNVGNIARSCAVLGLRLHLIRPFGFHLHDRPLKRAGMDYLPQVELCEHADWAAFLGQVPAGARVWGFTTKTDRVYSQVSYRAGDYLLFGPESRGLPDWVLAQTQALTLPMPGVGRSLNVAVAAGVASYEAMRQLHHNWQEE